MEASLLLPRREHLHALQIHLARTGALHLRGEEMLYRVAAPNAEAWYQKAMASARMLDAAGALKDLEKATQAKPSKLLAAQIRQAQGRLLARQGQPEEARKGWRAWRVRELTPGERVARLWIS